MNVLLYESILSLLVSTNDNNNDNETLLLLFVSLFVYVPVCVASLRMFVSVLMSLRYSIIPDVCFSTDLWNIRYSISISLDVCFSTDVVGLRYSISLVMFVSVPIFLFHEIPYMLITFYYPFLF